jgi:hypothetical protein
VHATPAILNMSPADWLRVASGHGQDPPPTHNLCHRLRGLLLPALVALVAFVALGGRRRRRRGGGVLGFGYSSLCKRKGQASEGACAE